MSALGSQKQTLLVKGCMPSALSAQRVGSMVDRTTVFDPILKGTEVVDFPIAHILKNLSA